MPLEIACFNIKSAEIAQKSGADRIEFCKEKELGGTTPDLEDFIQLKTSVKTKTLVMIRPRGGNFVYSEEEFSLMKKHISAFKNTKADGFVFGILNAENEIDFEKNKELVKLSAPFPCTFHKAFDMVTDLEKSLKELISCGFSTVLSSGLKPNVQQGKENLKKMVALSDGRIEILIGGGLRSKNIEEIKDFTGAKWFHSSALVDDSEFANEEEIKEILKFC